jgi:hypothetical protein
MWRTSFNNLDMAERFQHKGISMFGGRDYSYGPGGRYGGVVPLPFTDTHGTLIRVAIITAGFLPCMT